MKYTPTTDQVRSIFAGDGDWTHSGTADERYEEFDAWLEEVKSDAYWNGFADGQDTMR